ncbi:MAG: hypothetical protein ACOX3U_02330 [Christensenellales bacterium]|jgi:uncharacterized membrane protein
MKKNKYMYTGIGIALGTAIAASLCLTLYALTLNPLFIPFIGIGTVVGLIFGSNLDRSAQKKEKESDKGDKRL